MIRRLILVSAFNFFCSITLASSDSLLLESISLFQEGRIEKSLSLVFEIEKNIFKTTDIEAQMALLKLKSAILEQQGEQKLSFFALDKFKTLQDSFLNLQSEKLLQEMSARYETEKSSQEIELLKQQSELSRLKSEKQNRGRYFLFAGLGLMSLLLLAGIKAFYIKRQDNEQLAVQKKKIQIQFSTIEQQKIAIEEQLSTITHQKQHITDSITYASRIQKALLPRGEEIAAALPEHFVLFMPRDIVSGDFYWLKRLGDYTFIAAADCTGHGVPGAFMSMLGIAFLNEIVLENANLSPAQILEKLRSKVKEALRQTNRFSESKDGMDIALCMINHKEMMLTYSGAYNPLWLYRKGILHEIKANRNPIAWFVKEKPFVDNEWPLAPNDRFYIFSDGFPDQMGGAEGKKFMSKRFKALLAGFEKTAMPEQEDKLRQTILSWMNEAAIGQMDDICIIGIRA